MASSTAMRDALRILHYCVPVLVFVYYISASILGICTLQAGTLKLHRKLKITIVSLIATVVVSYLLEAVCIIVQIFNDPGQYSSKDYNIFALASSLVWTVLGASILESSDHQWYAYWGAWMIALLTEGTITVLSTELHEPSSSMEWVQVTLHILRMLTISALIVAYFSHSRQTPAPDDEESTPLLAQNGQQPEVARLSSLGSSTPDITATVTAMADEEATKRAKKEKEKVDKLNTRLEEEGSWFNYLRGYSVFVPYLWPTNNPILMLNMVGVAVCMLAERGLNILVPRQLGLLVTALGQRNSQVFGSLGLYVFLSWLNSYSGLAGLRHYFWLPVDSNARLCLYKASHSHIMDLSCDFHDEKQSGELYTAMSQGNHLVTLLESVLIDFLPIIIDLFLALGYFYVLFDSYLVLIGAATMIAYFWGAIYIANIQIKCQRLENAAVRKRMQVMYDTLGEWKTVTYFNRVPYAKQIYGASVSFWQKLWNKVRLLFYFGFGISNSILDLGSFAAYFFAAYQVYIGSKDVGTFVTLVSYWSNFTMPIVMLARAHKDVLDQLVDAEELLSLYKRVPSVQDGPNEMHVTKARVVFDRVSFDYNGKKSIINDVSLVAEPGKTVALIGETGAGKSTLIKLLFRFYDVTKGGISIDGQDIRNVTMQSLRDHIGVVPQDASLFNDTIISNLRYAKLNATEEEIHDACKAAAVHEKILQFPDGYLSKVGEKGVKLSGGELQRIAIARAILKNPKIILLDEATSSVDNDTESKIQEGLKKLCKGRTTFVVAHRLSTIMEADMILVIKDGSVLESGAPSDLLKQQGKYYHLWSKQKGMVDVLERSDNSDTAVETSPTTSASDGEPKGLDASNGKAPYTDSPRIELSEASTSKTGNSRRARKRLRADAPPFVPNSSIGSAINYGTLQSSKTAQDSAQGAPNGEPRTAAHLSHHGNTKADSVQGNKQADTSGAKVSNPAAANYSSYNHRQVSPRRHAQSISDPGHLQPNQTEASQGPSTQRDRSSSRPPAARHISAPSDTPAGLSTSRAGNQRRRRQRHWRNKDDAADSEESSSGESGEWAEEQAAPAPSPAEGAPTANSGRVAGNAVRFAAGA